MEAKDTVMSYPETVEAVWKLKDYDMRGRKISAGLADAIKLPQAEISFKVGKVQGLAESAEPLLKAVEDGYKAGTEEESTQAYHAGIHDGILRGRREVVEWLAAHNYYCIGIKDKFKEWGL